MNTTLISLQKQRNYLDRGLTEREILDKRSMRLREQFQMSKGPENGGVEVSEVTDIMCWVESRSGKRAGTDIVCDVWA